MVLGPRGHWQLKVGDWSGVQEKGGLDKTYWYFFFFIRDAMVSLFTAADTECSKRLYWENPVERERQKPAVEMYFPGETKGEPPLWDCILAPLQDAPTLGSGFRATRRHNLTSALRQRGSPWCYHMWCWSPLSVSTWSNLLLCVSEQITDSLLVCKKHAFFVNFFICFTLLFSLCNYRLSLSLNCVKRQLAHVTIMSLGSPCPSPLDIQRHLLFLKGWMNDRPWWRTVAAL